MPTESASLFSAEKSAIPPEHREHQLLCSRHFFTLPSFVLERVVEVVGEDRFDRELLVLERKLSTACGDHTSQVGFYDGHCIRYAELRPKIIPPFSIDLAKSAGLQPAQVERALKLYADRDVEELGRYSRGYCGWLMTNKQFLDEHDKLYSNGRNQSPRSELDAAARQNLRDEYDAFLVRWRLQSVVAPYLPVPCKPLFAGGLLANDIQHLMNTGGVFYLPDVMPMPSRDQLRSRLDDALHRGDRPQHLQEWLEIVRAGNTARNQMDPFARMFELQHYWRLLRERHADAIHRKIGDLANAFSSVFGVSSQRIKSDLAAIRRRLGPGWLSRPWPLDVGACAKAPDPV
ncbi:MAG: hypothetical protein KDB14_33045 [Planctomycetales bacterium]|nr:hypothetical protein [Planctomycetales bacterium]